MQGSYITLKEVLETMDAGKTFDIRVITMSGEILELHDARKHSTQSPAEQKKQQQLQPSSRVLRKDPRHYQHSTRNILLANGEIRKIKIRLIRRFNGKIVL